MLWWANATIRLAAKSFSYHHVGRLDDRPGLVSFLEVKIGHCFVGDGRGNDDPLTNVNPHMRGRCAPCHVDDLTLELIACAKLHVHLLAFRPLSNLIELFPGQPRRCGQAEVSGMLVNLYRSPYSVEYSARS